MSIGIYLLSKPNFLEEEVSRFLNECGEQWRRSSDASPAESLIEIAGRICYMSFGERQSPRSNAEYLTNLISQGHESVLEHANWTFLIRGVSRAFTHQLVRHRAGFAFSQLSQQYHEERDARFVKPDYVKNDPRLQSIWRQAIDHAEASYREILDLLEQDSNVNSTYGRKEHRRAILSAARSVLPNATATTIVVTANARALRHFLTVRGGLVGDEEMRRVCERLLTLLRTSAPALFLDFTIETLPDGSPVVQRRSAV